LVYVTGHELRSSVVPAALLVDGELLADSFALFAEQRVSAAIALSRRAHAARAAGQAEQEAMREREEAQLRELVGL